MADTDPLLLRHEDPFISSFLSLRKVSAADSQEIKRVPTEGLRGGKFSSIVSRFKLV